MSVATDEENPPVEGRARRRGRRYWSKEEKRRIVAETLEPGASVSIVARRHDVNANQVFSWRRQFASEPLSFVPVVVAPEAASCGMPSSEAAREEPLEQVPATPAAMSGRMEIVLSCGGRIIVDRTVNAAALARVVGVLGRR
jgi:transposase